MKKIVLIALVVFALVFAGCTQTNPNTGANSNPNNSGGNAVDLSKVVEKGDTVKVEYKGAFENGEEFDSSAKFGQPLEFKAGAGQMIKGFDAAVIGMRLEEEKIITLKPEDAYGFRDGKKVIEIPKSQIANFESLKVGMTVSSPEAGNGTVKEIKSDSAVIDFNHPMAGKTLVFWIKIVAIEKAK